MTYPRRPVEVVIAEKTKNDVPEDADQGRHCGENQQ